MLKHGNFGTKSDERATKHYGRADSVGDLRIFRTLEFYLYINKCAMVCKFLLIPIENLLLLYMLISACIYVLPVLASKQHHKSFLFRSMSDPTAIASALLLYSFLLQLFRENHFRNTLAYVFVTGNLIDFCARLTLKTG